MTTTVPPDLPRLPARPADAHKGSVGRLTIIGASPGLTGAVVLAQAAALRSGAGLVTCAVPASLALVFEIKTTEAMTLALPDVDGVLTRTSLDALDPVLERSDAIALGPGMGRHRDSRDFVAGLLDRWGDRPHVIDADALWHLAMLTAIPARARRVVTPHPGEFGRLIDAFGIEPSQGAGRELAQRLGGVVVRKGPHRDPESERCRATRTIDARRDVENESGNPGLATGGTGDVLGGIIGALLAAGLDAFDAARLGNWLHGAAADRACHGADSGDRGVGERSMIASDVVADLAPTIGAVASAQQDIDK